MTEPSPFVETGLGKYSVPTCHWTVRLGTGPDLVVPITTEAQGLLVLRSRGENVGEYSLDFIPGDGTGACDARGFVELRRTTLGP